MARTRRSSGGRYVNLFAGWYKPDLPLLGDNLVLDPIIHIPRQDVPVQQIVLTFIGPILDNRIRSGFADTGQFVEVLG